MSQNISRLPMTQVIMLLLFPIGLYFYIQERKARPMYEKTFTDFESKLRADTQLTKEGRKEQYKVMLLKNEYKLKEDHSLVIGEKKIFSMSLFAMSLGLFYVGAVIYLLYFYYIQSPHRIVFDIQGRK